MTPDQPPAPRQDDEQAAGGVTLTEDERERVLRAVHKGDDRIHRAFALLDVMREVAMDPDMGVIEVQGRFIRWADAHGEASVERALEAVERILTAHRDAAEAERADVLEAARALLRTGSRPTTGSATAQVNAAALDRLRAALAASTERGQ